MNLWVIFAITVSVFLIVSLILLIIIIRKIKQEKLSKITKDINNCYNDSLNFKKISKKELSVPIDNIKEDIYYSDKVVNGKYQNVNKFNAQNINLKIEDSIVKKNNKELFLRYKLRDVNFFKSSDFIPLNQVDILLSQTSIYFIDSFESQIIPIAEIKNITFFWEKNNHLSSRKKFIGVEIFCYDKRIFLLFNEYENAITFVTNIIMLS
ncbi:hypothetical protein [Spiroplasma sp. AdecLV25b]|uniref:hypothetical protein n=1 Tax=Spiroplasma sp. AdecLV25b TaxID=3027162 RepID=UPI0027E16D6F|nr:hypothetical protein [Spiroplasma sp. AdecLV25b]